jgi:maltooligosyltrehalose trehalohydrolase
MGSGNAGAVVAAQEKTVSRHSMPFGAEVLPGGGTRFRLWAPGAEQVDLVTGPKTLPMQRASDGWYELTDPQSGPGTLYRYRIDGELLVPDPASRFQPQDVDGPSEVVNPAAYKWSDHAWSGRP